MSGYRRVRVAGDELVHYAGTDTDRTIGCARVVVAEWATAGEETGDLELPDQPRCGECVVEWMAATGQIRLVERLPTVLPPELSIPRRVVDP